MNVGGVMHVSYVIQARKKRLDGGGRGWRY